MPSTPAQAADLPTPAQLPEADVVIFDGQCRFCLSQAQRLARWDKRRRLAFLSLHDPEVRRRWPQLSHQQLMEQMYVAASDGPLRGGAAALRYLSRQIPRLWALWPLLHLPASLPFWQFVYRTVAQRRYRFSRYVACDEGATCHLHRGRREN